ncbi:Hemerythrin HHE cation binding domain protein [uncultured archaeon]|nr:Hemerythrin HHE cation binding domain protein [uncultured archaeon]
MFWQKKLSGFMKKEHGKMQSMLDKLDYTNKDFEIFSKLKKILENHIYAEEKAIHLLHKRGKMFPALSKVIEEHNDIEISLYELVGPNIKTKEIKLKKIQALAELLRNHLENEDKNFYPYLDSNLNSEEREEIFEILEKNLD